MTTEIKAQNEEVNQLDYNLDQADLKNEICTE